MRLLLDTNIIISGLISTKGPPGALLHAWLHNSCFELVTSEEQIAELTRAMSYDHLRARIRPEQALNVLENIDAQAIIATDLQAIEVSPDPDDNMILATAVAGNADAVVSGDNRDVVALGEIEGIPIITAREAVERLGIEAE